MQAAQLMKYDKNFKLIVKDIPVPVPNDNEVLVKVKAAAVNPLDTLIGTGFVKLMANYNLPLTMGNELSGVIESVGRNVKNFKIGDAVYSRLPLTKIGAFAEYVAIDYRDIYFIPKNLDFDHSAAVPLTGLTALQGLTEELQVQSGKSIMIPGGSGSFGQMAIPIAKELGLKVMVSGNARSKQSALDMGVDQYFDYRKENYWEHLSDIDYVIDTIGKKELDHELKIMKPNGRILSLIMGPNRKFAQDHNFSFLKTTLFTIAGLNLDSKAKKAGVDYRFIFVRSDGKQLQKITQIVEANQIEPAIDPTEFKLSDINEAINYAQTGHPKGKVLIKF
ncbi:NADP-dependent oxidoreductase [Companilactobacillus nantensis]|uniref:NADPH-quinone alcohol dehydrogenase, Zn-dependent n=1 Tax=Companilactobacillus nantensis DSM 16982 TaxID=1423774 RepID=A0A0R1WGZ4_9LACO|nr:NADP-dependent oxidoreductase [Companilactobacillus nantensis]KRM17136.1 NADPH-quinone alcohol dehydrogenase, Zn-dependent [Companilactobacillus nantensis DSM 16982]GEO64073.1 oxidoreductase [Companilactobacillus nantensis]